MGPLQNPIDIRCRPPVQIGAARTVGHEPTVFHVQPELIERGQSVPGRQLDQARAPCTEIRRWQHVNGADPLAACRLEGAFEVGLGGDTERARDQTEAACCVLCCRQDRLRARDVAQQSDPGEVGHGFLQQLELLGDQLVELRSQARHVAARARQCLHEAHRNRIDQEHENHGNGAGGLLRSSDRRCAREHDDIDLGLDQLRDKRRQTSRVSFGPAVDDGEGAPLDPSQLAQPLMKGLELRIPGGRVAVAEEPDAGNFAGLCLGDVWHGTGKRCHRADERSPIRHAATSRRRAVEGNHRVVDFDATTPRIEAFAEPLTSDGAVHY